MTRPTMSTNTTLPIALTKVTFKILLVLNWTTIRHMLGSSLLPANRIHGKVHYSCLQKDSGDARATSFLKILDLIPEMSKPPSILFVENVVGFETSDTHKQMVEILVNCGFITQEYILTPLQFGIPYSRPRYFCLAKRKPLAFQNPLVNSQLLWSPRPMLENDVRTLMDDLDGSHERWKEWLESCKPIEDFLEFRTSSKLDNADCNVSVVDCRTLAKNDESPKNYAVPLSLIERWGSAMDIVYPDSRRCCCFTKSYFRYVKGTGSLLATIQPQKDKLSSLKEQGLRYFTPREVANLHSLPEEFQFPPHISLKQRYALLGNSLSIAVVASLLRYLFTEPLEPL